ncbi:beta family protein [Streptantibioticus silvisoli]|uniref:T4 beta protein n=1 Tax=Streptantibioticus silvisoli TaxID=2705255 RepID=A0ABT6VRU2_9ACTN|nr:hypothetical protein [Streptantibioticus silvisoli]MDI5961200.1 hypothetical protein [Streptantibioticus silvisoli]
MAGPLHVPVLPTRPHAADAYRRLHPDVQRAVAPLWTLPPHAGLPPSALAVALEKDLAVVAQVQRYSPAWFDAPFADETQTGAIASILRKAAATGPLRLVTGPGRPLAQQVSALETALRSGNGNGIGVRVRVPGEWDFAVTEQVRDLLGRAGPTLRVDLLLDMAGVLADRPDAGKEALRALDALVPLAPWRTVATIAGGVRPATLDMVDPGLREEPRTEWEMWREVADSGRACLPLLTYGDYGVLSAAALARDARSGNGGPPWGVLRYTTERSHVLVKTLAKGEGRIAHNRAAAQQLTALPDFRGAVAGAAEVWLRDCASGVGGTGNFGTWNWVGNAQHMTYVVNSLRFEQ